MEASNSPLRRNIVGRVPMIAGNAIQIAGVAAACAALALARSPNSKPAAIVAMIAAWILLYFFCHGIAHWAVGRLLGIRFAFYTVGELAILKAIPPACDGCSSISPSLECRRRRPRCQQASPMAKAIMWSAGVTSSAVVPTLGALCAWKSGGPGSKLFLIFAVFWAIGTLASNWRSPSGDYSKARRALDHFDRRLSVCIVYGIVIQ